MKGGRQQGGRKMNGGRETARREEERCGGRDAARRKMESHYSQQETLTASHKQATASEMLCNVVPTNSTSTGVQVYSYSLTYLINGTKRP